MQCDVSVGRYYLARSADGECLMITFECVRCYGFRDPPDIPHDKNGFPCASILLLNFSFLRRIQAWLDQVSSFGGEFAASAHTLCS
jgi:hypothetical protein